MGAGYDRLQGLLNGTEAPVVPDDPDREAVEFLQEMIRCHGYRKVPGRKNHTTPTLPDGETFGKFGRYTGRAVEAFKKKYDLAHPQAKLPTTTPKTIVDQATLQALVNWLDNHSTPGAGRLYLDKVLGRTFTVWDKMASLISTHEESPNGGGFTAVSPKSQTWLDANGDGVCDKGPCDEAGLSYGIIQFTHESGRLATLAQNMRTTAQSLFDQTFRVPGTTIAGLLDHLNRFAEQTEHGIARPAFQTYDLYNASWTNCFVSAGRKVEFQKLQLDAAVTALKASYQLMKVTGGGYATHLTNERGIGFWLDLVNQLGDTRARTRYTEVVTALTAAGVAVNQANILDKVVAQSSFKDRRKYFRDHAPLTDPADPFATA